jgi:alpha-galactosidase
MRDRVTIAIIGAGSVVFSKGTIGDILLNETLTHYPIDLRLMDIVPARLAGVVQFATTNAAALHRQLTATATTNLRVAVDGADFVVTAFEVDRYQRWAQDFHIPRKYGFAQIYGENGGPGGMFHALRNMGPLLEVAHAMEELCPQAWLINYSNPEAKLVQAVAALTKVNVAGMCHGVFMGREQVSALLELPEDQIETAACGLNHFAWFQAIRNKETGEDLYPLLREKERQAHWLARWDELALSRILFRTFGLWPYPGTNHSGEYLRWAGAFMASEGMQYFYDPAETGAQASADGSSEPALPPERMQARTPARQPAFVYDLAGHPTETPLYGAEDVTQVYPTWESVTDGGTLQSSGEEGVRIMEGIIGGTPLAIATVNMANHGCIPGLPDAMVVEAPAVADGEGLHLQPMAPLPTGITAMLTLQGQINALLIEAYVERSKRKLLQALLIDPTVASYNGAVALIDEMCEVQKGILPAMAW